MEQEIHSAHHQIDVMIIDDVTENLSLLTDILKNNNYNIRLATDANIALRSIKAKHPFIILLDVQLPGMDGYELCKVLKADDATKGIPVIFITVHSSSESKLKAFESGGVDYITKPILVEEVLARVAVHIQIRTLQLEEERNRSILQKEIEEHRLDKNELSNNSAIVNALLEKEKRNAKALLGILKDQKEVMASLKESELRFRSVTESANEAIITADSKGIIVDWNRSAEKIFGYPKSEIIGKNLNIIIPKSIVDKHNSGIKRMELGGDRHVIGKTLELFGLHMNGKEFPLELSLAEWETGSRQYFTGIIRDISDRYNADKELKISEDKYRTIFENVQDVYFETMVNGTILEISPSIEIVSKGQYHHTDLIGKSMYDFYYNPDDRLSMLAQLQKTGHINDYEVQFTNRDGSILTCSISLKVIRDAESQVQKIIGSMRDISERKHIEQKLTENEKRLGDIIFSVGDWVWELDKNGVYTYGSQKGFELLGRSKEDILGKTPFDFMNPDEAQRVRKVFSDIAARKGYIKDLENWYVKKNGETICLLTNGVPILDKDDNLTGYRGVDKDITERKKAEDQIQRLSAAVEQSPVSIVIANLEGTIEYVNKKFIDVTGYSYNEAIGKNSRILKSGETTVDEYKTLWETITAGKEWRGEFHNKKKNGELYWESAAISPIVVDQGKTTHYLAVKEDITEQKEMQKQMFRSQRMESIGTLAGGIAHDLNNILGPILLSAQILRMKVHEEELQSLINTIELSTIRGKNIIAQVLGFARGVESKFILMQIRHIVQEVEDIIKQTFEKNISFQSYASKDLWTVNADPTQIHQALMNLCVNARDAMSNGGNLKINVKNVEVDDTFRNHHQNANKERYLEIEVRDTGSGIPPEIQQKIFDPFFTTKDIGKGTGLGLSTVYSIVKAHSGFIEMESIVGKGTVFQIYIPAVTESEGTVEHYSCVNIVQGNSETILVIDDEEPIRSTCEEVLKFYNYSVVTANNGSEGITTLIQKRMKFQVALIDMMMPVMDGKIASAAIKKIEPNIKIIGMSGMMDQSKIDNGDKAFDLFLRKPFSTQELIEAVQTVLASNKTDAT